MRNHNHVDGDDIGQQYEDLYGSSVCHNGDSWGGLHGLQMVPGTRQRDVRGNLGSGTACPNGKRGAHQWLYHHERIITQ